MIIIFFFFNALYISYLLAGELLGVFCLDCRRVETFELLSVTDWEAPEVLRGFKGET